MTPTGARRAAKSKKSAWLQREASKAVKADPECIQRVAAAIVRCLQVQSRPPQKGSDIRKRLLWASHTAAAVAKNIMSLRQALDELGELAPQYRKWLRLGGIAGVLVPAEPKAGAVKNVLHSDAARLDINPAALPAMAARFDELAAIAARHAKNRKHIEKGGAPKMLAFGTLVDGLADAFKVSTGKEAKVTWNPYHDCYTGRFLELVEAALPIAVDLAKRLGVPLQYPQTALSRGKYVYGKTRKGRKKRGLFTD